MAKSPYSKEAMQERLDVVNAEVDKILAKSLPIREERDAYVAEYTKKDQALIAKMRKAEEGLFELRQEQAALQRAVGTTHELVAEAPIVPEAGAPVEG